MTTWHPYITSELQEAAHVLQTFMQDKEQLDRISQACLLYTSDAADE